MGNMPMSPDQEQALQNFLKNRGPQVQQGTGEAPNPAAGRLGTFDQYLNKNVAPWQQQLGNGPVLTDPTGLGQIGGNGGLDPAKAALADYSKLMGIQQTGDVNAVNALTSMGNLAVNQANANTNAQLAAHNMANDTMLSKLAAAKLQGGGSMEDAAAIVRGWGRIMPQANTGQPMFNAQPFPSLGQTSFAPQGPINQPGGGSPGLAQARQMAPAPQGGMPGQPPAGGPFQVGQPAGIPPGGGPGAMPNPAVAPGDQDHGAILGDNAVAAAKAARGGGVGAMASALKKTMGEEAFAKNQPAVVAFLNQQFDPTQVHRAINPGTASSLWTRTLNALPGVSPNDAEITLSQMRNAQGGQQPGLIRGMNTAAPYTPNLLWGPFAPAELLIRNAMGGN